jgi:hypothetical protein
MTFQQVEWAVAFAAQIAAESAMDAFGNDCLAELPSAEDAWTFLNDHLYVNGGMGRPAALPDVLTRQFRNDYEQHLQKMIAERNLPVV